MKLLLIFLLSFNLCYAQQIKPIQQGKEAPYDGYVIDYKFEKEIRKEAHKLDLEKNKNAVLRQLGEVRDREVEFYKQEAREAKKELRKEKWKKVLYTVLGVIAGGGAIYLGSKIAK